jgi:hypothetical protein
MSDVSNLIYLRIREIEKHHFTGSSEFIAAIDSAVARYKREVAIAQSTMDFVSEGTPRFPPGRSST